MSVIYTNNRITSTDGGYSSSDYQPSSGLFKTYPTFETKKKITTGSGMDLHRFTAAEKKKIITIINFLWNSNIDLVTQQRVFQALSRKDIPVGMLNDIEKNFSFFRADKFNPSMTDSVTTAGTFSTAQINRVILGTSFFNNVDMGVTNFIENEGLALVKFLEDQTIANLTNTIRTGLKKDWSNLAIRNMMVNDMTLTEVEAVRLKKLYDKAIKLGKNQQQALGEMNRAARRLKRIRADRIARTEIVRAKHQGDQEAYMQVLNDGRIKAAIKTWRRNNYDDNWESSKKFDGRTVDVKSSFGSLPAGSTMSHSRYPNEINELCSLEYGVEV